MRARLAIAVLGLGLLVPATAHACTPAGFDPAEEPPFGGETPTLSAPLAQGDTPAGFQLTAGQATATATAGLTPSGSVRRFEVRTRSGPGALRLWQIDYLDADGDDVGQVIVDDAGSSLVSTCVPVQLSTTQEPASSTITWPTSSPSASK